MKNKPKYLFKCDNGKVYAVCEDMCLVCKHCTDIFYDFNGPYMCFCDINEGSVVDFTCNMFDLDLEDEKIEIYKGDEK